MRRCGYRGDTRRQCQCNRIVVERYAGKLSGPLLDRIDIHIEVPAVPFKELSSERSGTNSQQMREQVLVARQKQQQRFAESKTRNNARMSSKELRTHCKLDKTSQDLLHQSVNELGLSARAHDKVLRVARTIADLDGADRIEPMHVTEAINYRILDRKMWLG